jgi:hypothetical protein
MSAIIVRDLVAAFTQEDFIMFAKLLICFALCISWTTTVASEAPSSVEDFSNTDWVLVAEQRWARLFMWRGGKSVAQVDLTRDTVFFSVTMLCMSSPDQRSSIVWRAGSALGETRNCRNMRGTTDTVPYLEHMIGELPPKVAKKLQQVRTHPKEKHLQGV